MTLTGTQSTWARLHSAARELIALLPAHAGMQAERFATDDLALDESGTLQTYDARITEEIDIERSAGGELIGGSSSSRIGALVLTDSNLRLGRAIEQPWQGRPIQLYWGDPAWSTLDEWILIADTTIEGVTGRDQQIRLELRDPSAAADKVIPPTRWGSADGVPADDPAGSLGTPRALAYGLCRHIPARLLDPVRNLWGVAVNSTSIVDVHNNGSKLTPVSQWRPAPNVSSGGEEFSNPDFSPAPSTGWTDTVSNVDPITPAWQLIPGRIGEQERWIYRVDFPDTNALMEISQLVTGLSTNKTYQLSVVLSFPGGNRIPVFRVLADAVEIANLDRLPGGVHRFFWQPTSASHTIRFRVDAADYGPGDFQVLGQELHLLAVSLREFTEAGTDEAVIELLISDPETVTVTTVTADTSMTASIQQLAADVGIASVDAAAIDALTDRPRQASDYIGDEVNLLRHLDQMAASIGSVVAFTRAGQLTARRVSPISTFSARFDEQAINGIEVSRELPVKDRLTVSWRQTWTEFDDAQIDQALTLTQRAQLKRQAGTSVASLTEVDETEQVPPEDTLRFNTLLSNRADAVEEARKWLQVIGRPRHIITVDGLLGALQYDLLDAVLVTDKTFPWTAPLSDEMGQPITDEIGEPIHEGVIVLVTGVRERYPSGSITLEGWF